MPLLLLSSLTARLHGHVRDQLFEGYLCLPSFVIPDMCLFSFQAVVTQESSLTVSPGGTVTLPCGSNTGAVTSDHRPSWFQQKPGQVPTTLVSDIHMRKVWTPVWFSGSTLRSKSAPTLLGAQPEDEAEYYCWLVYSGARHSERPRWGTRK